MRARFAGLLLLAAAAALPGQEMSIEEYEPKSTLVVPGHRPQKAKYPFIDVHNHQDRDMSAADAARLVADMDRINLRVMVNLSGGRGEELEKGLRNLAGRYPGRFVAFANVDYTGIETPGWGERAAAQLSADVRRGARGLKIFKNLRRYGTTGSRSHGRGLVL
ncbi:MAG: amidohydrolase, partial [Thermoanaerobaculia bacterium]